jgi:allantoate deiminase
MPSLEQATQVVEWCRRLAECTEQAGAITRTYLSPPMRDVHAQLTRWMSELGMNVHVDAAGNLRGLYQAAPGGSSRRLVIASHLDSVPQGGAFDGVLGVVLAIALVDRLGGKRLPYAIEVIGFADEEGTRFGVPFIGSRSVAGTLDAALLERRDANGRSVVDAIADFGLDPARLDQARLAADAIGYLECHIEQGPVLDRMNAPVAVVTAIAGQSRALLTFTGAANHAGTTPMNARRDALAGAAEWIAAVEHEGRETPDLVATVGQVEVDPGAANVIPGHCRATLDLRHRDDRIRHAAYGRLLNVAKGIAARRDLDVDVEPRLDQAAVPMDEGMTARLVTAVETIGQPVHCMPSGAGHDAMVMAAVVPIGMLFLRSPGGISHHPAETVRAEDVEVALQVGLQFLQGLARD